MSRNEPFTQVALATRTLVELPFQRAVAAIASPDHPTREGHLSWMLARAIGFREQGNLEKACLWLGFVQGVLAMRGLPLWELDLANRDKSNLGFYAGPPVITTPP